MQRRWLCLLVSSFIFTILLLSDAKPTQSARTPASPLPSNPWTTVLTLNPTWDANGACVEPFSSGTGYKGTPQWVHHAIDLSAYANKAIRIRFYFDTLDPLYNKFEGWYLDNIKIGNFSDNVEAGNKGWTVEGSHTSPAWHISSKRSGVTQTQSWLYQDESRGSFQAGTTGDTCSDERSWGILTSPVICLGNHPQLEFDTLWEIESVDPHAFDLMQVQVEEMGSGIAPNGLNVCELQQGDIVMMNASGALYFAESKLFNGYWGHTGIYYGDGQIVESYPDGFWPVDTPGVVRRSIDQSGFWQAADWVILRLKDQFNHGKQGSAAAYASGRQGAHYNWDYTNKEQTGSFYCTQLVWRSYKSGGNPIDLDSNASVCKIFKSFCTAAVTPDDIFYSDYLRTASSREQKRAVFYLGSPAHFYITDPFGQHAGVDPNTGLIVNTIPGVFYSGPDDVPEYIAIPNLEGEWKIQIVGIGSGDYTLVTEVVDSDNHEMRQIKGSVDTGTTLEYQASYPLENGEPVQIAYPLSGFETKQAQAWHFDNRADEFFLKGELALPEGFAPGDLVGSARLVIKTNNQTWWDKVTLHGVHNLWRYYSKRDGPGINRMQLLWSEKDGKHKAEFWIGGRIEELFPEALVRLELPITPAENGEVLAGETLPTFHISDLSKPVPPAQPPRPTSK